MTFINIVAKVFVYFFGAITQLFRSLNKPGEISAKYRSNNIVLIQIIVFLYEIFIAIWYDVFNQ